MLAAGCAGRQQPSSPPKPQVTFREKIVAFQIGETRLDTRVRVFGRSSLTMVNVHDDEQASVDAALVVLRKHGGRLIELVHTGKRRVVFKLNGQEYHFDPNRIFSKTGVRLTLRSEGSIPEEAYEAVDVFAAQFIDYFKLHKREGFITLHNNGDGEFSIKSYQPGAELAADTDELYVNPQSDPDDFYFVTRKVDFDALQENKLNVILQDNTIRRDDGSLSVMAGRRGLPYINVEAQPDHLEEQIKMIDLAADLMSATDN